MKAYRTVLTVNDPKQVVLTDVPFEPGQRVEILVLPQNKSGAAAAQRWKSLAGETQAFPQLQKLSEEEISAEVNAYRSGQ